MDKLTELRHYTAGYYRLATQHCTSRIAREWMEAGVPVEQAAAWANLGYLPAEATPLMASGMTPETVTEMEQHAERPAGGAEALREQRIAQMVQAGEVVDPARAIRVQDPTDPRCEIIAVRDEEG